MSREAARAAEYDYCEAQMAEIWARLIAKPVEDVPTPGLLSRVGRLFGFMAAHAILESPSRTMKERKVAFALFHRAMRDAYMTIYVRSGN